MTSVPSWLAAVAIVVPAAAGLLGYRLAGRNEEARDVRAAAREDVARRAAIGERFESDAHAFQRELLLDLQGQLHAVVRTTARIIFRDQETLRETGQMYQLGEELNQASFDAGINLRRAYERLLDAELRKALAAFQAFVTEAEVRCLQLKDEAPEHAIAQLEAELGAVTEHYLAANELLGTAVRAALRGVATAPELDRQQV
jgi:hypothetical protein